MFRLQKIMDEYAGGITAQFTTNEALLKKALELLAYPEGRLRQTGRIEPARADALLGEQHRMWQAEAHVRTVLFREETRWPGYYFRADKPALDEENWHVFANCRFDPKTNTWEIMARPILHVFSPQPKEPAVARV